MKMKNNNFWNKRVYWKACHHLQEWG